MATPIQTSFDFPLIISREEARAAGYKFYFTGVPCNHGHLSERRVTYGKCLECEVSDNRLNHDRQWRERNKETLAAGKRAWAEANPVNVAINRERAHAKRRELLSKNQKFRQAYNAKGAEYRRHRLLAKATRPKPEGCEICGATDGKICFDHCHNTGEFRGWLCNRCNLMIGKAEDSEELFLRIAEYIRTFKNRCPITKT